MYDCTLQCLRYLPQLKPSSLVGWSTAPLKRYSTHLFNLHPRKHSCVSRWGFLSRRPLVSESLSDSRGVSLAGDRRPCPADRPPCRPFLLSSSCPSSPQRGRSWRRSCRRGMLQVQAEGMLTV